MRCEIVSSSGDDIKTLRDYIESGVLKPHVSLTFPVAQRAEAHRQVESGRTVGKAVLRQISTGQDGLSDTQVCRSGSVFSDGGN